MFTAKGNAVGFTREGDTITGRYVAKKKCWHVEAVSPGLSCAPLTDARSRNFATKTQAEQYATELMDMAKTAELKWW